MVAILGGTFDPVHYGHLRAADEVRQALGLAQVLLVPSGDPPHRAAPVAPAIHRLAMLELAVEEFPGLAVDAREIARAGKSYTVLTLEELAAERPGEPVALIVGADAFRGFPTWHRWREVFDLAHVVVVTRPGVPIEPLPEPLAREWTTRHTTNAADLELARAGAIYAIAITPSPIASTTLRHALLRGSEGLAQVRGLLPSAVLAYIDRNQLYRSRQD